MLNMFFKNQIIFDEYQETFKTKQTKHGEQGRQFYVAKDVINEPFLVANADDHYGKQAYEEAINT